MRSPSGGGAVGHQQLGRTQAFELGRQHGQRRFQQPEVAAGEVEPGQPRALALDGDGQQQAVAAVVEQVGVGQRARRDDARHGAFDRALRGRRIADLFADGDRFAELDQLGEVLLNGVEGHAGHRDRLAGRLAALGQGDVEQARGLFGILEEQLVEVAHPVEQQQVGVLALQRQILLHDRRVPGEIEGRSCEHGFIFYRAVPAGSPCFVPTAKMPAFPLNWSITLSPIVAVCGLGYVGLPLAVEFGKKYETIGFDLSEAKIASYKKFIDPTGEVSTAKT